MAVEFLKRSSPEEKGISSKDMLDFFRALDESGIEFHHVTVIRDHAVIAQADWKPYKAEFRHMTHSLTKLFTNTAVGIACDQGKLSLDNKVVSFFPEFVPDEKDERLERMMVRDLITMRCGHAHLISGNKWRPIKTSWIAEFFKEHLAYEPGEHFQYTSATSYVLSAIIQKLYGCTTCDFLKKMLLDDLGISDISWDVSPQGVCSGGNGISIRNEDAAKLAILYMDDGVWNGKRYLSHEWIQEAMYDSCKLNPETGYGFHLCNENGIISSGGIFGQTVVMIPGQDLVISINAAHPGNRPNALDPAMRTLIERYLLPICRQLPLPEDPAAYRQLKAYLESRRLNGTELPEKMPDAGSFSRYSGIYMVEANEDQIQSLEFEFTEDGCTFSMTDHRGRHTVLCGNAKWVYSESSMTGYYLHHQYQTDHEAVAGMGWPENESEYKMKWVWCNMTFADTVNCIFEDDRVTFRRSVNVNTQDMERPVLKGKRKREE